MIFASSIVAIVMSLVGGGYALILLNNLREEYKSEAINNFFYYHILLLIFGIYSVLGSQVVSNILLKFEPNLTGIETITLFLPFLGVPILVAIWFFYIKTVFSLLNKNIPQYIAILFFTLSTAIFLIYGLALRKMLTQVPYSDLKLSQLVRVVYSIIELFIVIGTSIILFYNTLKVHDRSGKNLMRYFAISSIILFMFKALTLHLADHLWYARLYFLLIYFGGSLPLIILLRRHAQYLSSFTICSNKSGIILCGKYNITKREYEIIIEICKGKSNQQIADELFITLQTVKDHIHSIFRKVEVKNRVQLSQIFK